MLSNLNITSEFGNWYEHKSPFTHFRAKNVLTNIAYDKVSTAFNIILDATNNINPENSAYRLRRSGQKNYDAWMLRINRELATIFAPFFSEDFLRSLAELVSLPFIPRIEGALHSSPSNSRTGWIHHDFCSAWFDESNPGEGILYPNNGCEYFTGKLVDPSAKPVEYVRAAALIYYLCNDGWRNGDGGETALYGAAKETINTRYDLIKPINNTLFFFRCSPHSYHRFITNPGMTRNSIILWLHMEAGFAESKWGESINRRSSK